MVQEYNLLAYTRDGWVYFEIRRGVYGLPQSSMLSNKLLDQHLNKAGYYQCPATPGIWCHKWRPIIFCLIVDDFGIKYVGKRHTDHIRDILLEHYELTQDWSGSQFSGIDLTWDYTNRTFRMSIKNYIKNLLLKWGHAIPSKPQHAPFRHTTINYGAKHQFTNSPDASPKLDDAGIKRIQAIVGDLLYYGRAVNSKLLVSLSKLGSTQAAVTELDKADLSQLLNYLSTYPDNVILYCSSAIILVAYSDAAYPNVSRAHSCSGPHIMLSENTPVPSINEPIHTIAQIIKKRHVFCL